MKKGKPAISALTAACLLLGLLPTAALAADPQPRTTTLELIGESVSETSGDGWSWDAENRVLTLSGVDIRTVTDPVGISLPMNSTIHLAEGTVNTVASADVTGDANSYGVYDKNGVTVSGQADVTATGGTVTNQTSLGSFTDGSIGISAQDPVLVSGGRVAAMLTR